MSMFVFCFVGDCFVMYTNIIFLMYILGNIGVHIGEHWCTYWGTLVYIIGGTLVYIIGGTLVYIIGGTLVYILGNIGVREQ